jgi:transposase
MSQAFLGIDISKLKLDVALLTEPDRVKCKIFQQTPEGFQRFNAWLAKRGITQVHACMEATGNYFEDFAAFLIAQGHKVSVVNPAKIHAFAKSRLSRNKTDKLDATLIAHFCKSQNPEPYSPPHPSVKELQVLLRHYDSLVDALTLQKNRLASQEKFSQVAVSLRKIIHFLEQEIKEILNQIKDLIDNHPDLKNDRDLLASIPGIGELTASKIIAEIPHIKKFESAKQLVAFAGLNPQQHCSGSSIHKKTRISKTGSAKIRKMLFMPALVAKTHGPVFKNFENRLLKNGKSKMTVVGAIMRKLLHIAFGILKHNKPFDQNLAFAP